jgi:hypothetical protein
MLLEQLGEHMGTWKNSVDIIGNFVEKILGTKKS